MRTPTTPITVAHGDGIGPEIMAATLAVLERAGAALTLETVEIGERRYLAGQSDGIGDDAWESLARTRVFLKAPVTTPQGGGYRSLNVTTRRALGLYANVRPCVAYHPFVETRHPGMDVVVIRENEEDTYGGVEHRGSADVVRCLKIMTRPGCERIARYAFGYARAHGRKRVTCFTKDNIMKMTDGLFHRVFDEVAADYPDIESNHWIVDIGAAKLAATPEAFDVVVLPNLYGDILSDVAAQIAGSVGLAGSANIGAGAAMFEAIHGSAPRHAGRDTANPSGLLLAAVMMLVHIGQGDVAALIHNAWLRTIEDGVHTRDIFRGNPGERLVGTRDFAAAIIDRIGLRPVTLSPVEYPAARPMPAAPVDPVGRPAPAKVLVGVDLSVEWRGDPDALASRVAALAGPDLDLEDVACRGMSVWPRRHAGTLLVDEFRCRFVGRSGPVDHVVVVALLDRVARAGIDFVSAECLHRFDGQPGYSAAG